MSISTYAELVTALDGEDGYLHRSNLTLKIPDFIRLAESKINRKLRLLLQELETTLTATVGTRTMAVPTRFGTPIALWCTTYQPRDELIYVNPEGLPVTTSASASTYYTIDGDYVAVENPADIAYTYTFRYLTTFNLQTTSTNTVLTDYPDVYLYGALCESVSLTQDFEKLGVWQGKFDAAIKEAISDTNATKSKAMLRTEFSTSRPNIIRGY